VENYDLKQEMLLHEIFDRINAQLTGFGYALRPDIGYDKIYFGEGVELSLVAKGEKAEFHWRRSILKILEGSIRSIAGSLVLLMVLIFGGEISHWSWSNFLLASIYTGILLASIIALIISVPIAIINSNTHAVKTQLLIQEIIREYRSRE
jgi:hypothetical protein